MKIWNQSSPIYRNNSGLSRPSYLMWQNWLVTSGRLTQLSTDTTPDSLMMWHANVALDMVLMAWHAEMTSDWHMAMAWHGTIHGFASVAPYAVLLTWHAMASNMFCWGHGFSAVVVLMWHVEMSPEWYMAGSDTWCCWYGRLGRSSPKSRSTKIFIFVFFFKFFRIS